MLEGIINTQPTSDVRWSLAWILGLVRHPRLVLYVYYMRSKLDAEYKRLQDTGIVEPVRYGWWALPAVPVLKHDGSARCVATTGSP